MERVTSYPYPLSQIVSLLPELTLAQLLAVKVEAAAAEAKLRARLSACADRDGERRRELLRRHYAKGGEPLKVVPAEDGPTDWAAPYEEEAVAQGQDGPDPQYAVAPRFGGTEARAVPADPFEGFPDLPPGYTPAPAARRIGGEQWEPEDVGPGLTEADHCPLTGCVPTGEESLDPNAPIPFDLADDDADDTPLVVPPFTDEQEGD